MAKHSSVRNLEEKKGGGVLQDIEFTLQLLALGEELHCSL